MTDYAPVLVTAATVLPVSLDEAKLHLREDGNDQDAVIDLYLNAAVAHLDGRSGWLGRAIVTQTWSQQFDGFCRRLRISLSPVASIASVKYRDEDDVEQTVASSQYELVNDASSPEIVFIDDYAFPTVRDQLPVLTVAFISGFGAPAAVPAAIKAAILLMVGDMHQNREAKVETGFIDNPTVRRLLDPYRRGWMA